MGAKTRLQAQSILTDRLCSHLDATYGVPCDVRRELLDLLGVEWRQQVWSDSEIGTWARRPVEPTAKGDDGHWREEINEFRKIIEKLGLQDYRRHFHTDDHDKLLGIATARNLLHYLCEADLVALRVPKSVWRALKTAAPCHVIGIGEDELPSQDDAKLRMAILTRHISRLATPM